MEEQNYDDKREARRKKRIKAQIISYTVLVCILSVIVIGAWQGVRLITNAFDKQESVPIQEEVATEDVSEPVPEEEIQEEVEEVVEEVDPIEPFIDELLAQMPLEDRVAGLFLVSPESITGVSKVVAAGSGTQEALSKYAVAGFVYTKSNIQNAAQFQEMIANTKTMSKYPLFYSVYEEGGDVTSLKAAGLDVAGFDSMWDIGSTNDTANAYQLGSTIGSYLKEYGINLDLAPVADIVTDATTSFMKERSFGSDPTIVSAMVSSAVQGFMETGISTCLKHFPGQGLTESDTSAGYSVIDRSYDELKSLELLPFQEGIRAGSEFIMMSHVTLPQISGDSIPASLSDVMIQTILRTDLGFQGVVITDALNKKAITEYYTTEEAVVMAIKAGADILLLPDDFEAAYTGLLTAVQNGEITEERINESLRRIYRVKYKDFMETQE